jgi:GH35 family endo-1,4-beta-xylanase
MNPLQKVILPGAVALLCAASAGALNAADGAGAAAGPGYVAQARENIERIRKGDATLRLLDASGRPLAGVRVRLDQISQDFLFGALSDAWMTPKFTPAEAGRFKELFAGLFNFTIAKVYWSYYEKTQGRPDWQKLDAFLDWCLDSRLTVKGHPLAWTHPAGTPDWIFGRPAGMADTLLQARIYNLVGGYKGRIDLWDVVNEPVNTVPWSVAMKEDSNPQGEIAAGRRYAVAKQELGDIVPWVERSFRWAAEANPRGNFILNEFFIFAKPEIRQKFCTLAKTLLERGVPVRGLGIQAHEPREMWFSPQQVKEALDQLAELKLPLHITEFTPQSSGKPIEGWRSGLWTEEAQAEFAEQIYTQAFGHPAVASINWWGFCDRDSWLEGGGLVDQDLKPKLVYQRLLKLIRTEWMTKGVERQTDASGRANFRGFFGQYRIEVIGPDGTVKIFEQHLQTDRENLWTIRL